MQLKDLWNVKWPTWFIDEFVAQDSRLLVEPE